MYSFDFFPKKKKIELCPFQGSFMAPQGLPIFKNSAFKHIFQKKGNPRDSMNFKIMSECLSERRTFIE